jgi:hypothetical protein
MELAILKQLDRLDTPLAFCGHRLDTRRPRHRREPTGRYAGLCPRAGRSHDCHPGPPWEQPTRHYVEHRGRCRDRTAVLYSWHR